MSTAGLQDTAIDIDVAGPEDYVDNVGPGLLPEGWYTVTLKDYTVNRDPVTGEFQGSITLNRLQVVDGECAGRYANDLRVWTTVYERKGIRVSGLGDILRGIDKTASWAGLEGAEALLDKAIDQQLPIRIKLNWEAYDRKAFEDKGGNRMVKKSPEQKALRKECTVKYMRNFPQFPDGSRNPQVKSPVSDNTLEARLSIDTVEPSRG
jgi:hypothetical protein